MEGLPTPSSLYDESLKMYNIMAARNMPIIEREFKKLAAEAVVGGLFYCTIPVGIVFRSAKFIEDIRLKFEEAGYKVYIDSTKRLITVDWSNAAGNPPNLIPIDQVD